MFYVIYLLLLYIFLQFLSYFIAFWLFYSILLSTPLIAGSHLICGAELF